MGSETSECASRFCERPELTGRRNDLLQTCSDGTRGRNGGSPECDPEASGNATSKRIEGGGSPKRGSESSEESMDGAGLSPEDTGRVIGGLEASEAAPVRRMSGDPLTRSSATSEYPLAGAAVTVVEPVVESVEVCTMCDLGERDARFRAAEVIQRRWRRGRPQLMGPTSIERGWVGARARQLGALSAHVTFLQNIFRRSRELRPGCWRRGGMAGVMTAVRRGRSYRCGGGKNLASDEQFEEQRERAERVLDWYRQYVQLLRRLQSGVTPTVVDVFCGGGGSSEGVRRAGGASLGIDVEAQPDFVRRFGSMSFSIGDGTSWADVGGVGRRVRAFGAGASPPCKFYSMTHRRGDAASQPPLIDATRDMLEALFEYWWMENVLGARKHMAAGATELYGALFGLRVDRARLIETSFEMHVDEELRCCGGRQRSCVLNAAWARAVGGDGSTYSGVRSADRAAQAISLRCRARRRGDAHLSSAPTRWAWTEAR